MKNIGATKFEYLAIGHLSLFYLMGIYLSRFNHKYFDKKFIVEDGPIEWFSVLILISAMVYCLSYVKKNWSKSRSAGICYFLMAMVFLFGAGEEVSWGQRIFDIYPPEFFIKHNTQYETNLHNLVYNGKKINKIIFGTGLGVFVGVYLLFFNLMYEKIDKFKKLIQTFHIPLPRIYHVILFILFFGLSFLIASPKRGELLELSSCLIFYMILINPKINFK